jgi:hypothetical protein
MKISTADFWKKRFLSFSWTPKILKSRAAKKKFCKTIFNLFANNKKTDLRKDHF